jgi:hypothetical protein
VIAPRLSKTMSIGERDRLPIDQPRQSVLRQIRLEPLRRGPIGISTALLVIAGATILVSAWSTGKEWRIDHSRYLLNRQALLMIQDDDRWRSAGLDAPNTAAPARLLITDALYNARIASALKPGPQRTNLLARARRDVEAARLRRPRWGDAWMLSAFIDSLQSPAMSEDERLAIIRSYIDAPLLHEGGLWRATRGLAYWNSFPRSTQEDIVSESAWLLNGVSPEERQALFGAARRSPAYAQVFQRWAALR